MSSYWLLQETVSQIKPLSEEYFLYPSSVTDPQPDLESDYKDMNSQSLLMEPSIMPSPPDTTSSRSANSSSSFLNFNDFYDDVQFQNVEPEATDELR